MKKILKLQKHCQLFLQCLFGEGGSIKLAELTISLTANLSNYQDLYCFS